MQPPLYAKLNSTEWAAINQVSLVVNQACTVPFCTAAQPPWSFAAPVA